MERFRKGTLHVPEQNEETRVEVMHALIRSYSLGMWVTLGDNELVANHIPFEVSAERGEFGTLVGHIAKANPIWSRTPSEVTDLVIFQGPQSYISPSWYPSKHEHGKAVPTWNYAVVHAYGRPSFIEAKSWLYDHVSSLTKRHEASQPLPWSLSDAPVDFTDRMIGAIVGVEIPIQKLIGKWKMSQNRSESDRRGVVAGLMEREDAQSTGVAGLIQKTLRGP
jgi:transcriptional regulator